MKKIFLLTSLFICFAVICFAQSSKRECDIVNSAAVVFTPVIASDNLDGGIGVFTINSGGSTVTFSPGNLQYVISTKSFRFAPNQYESILTNGDGRIYYPYAPSLCDNANISSPSYLLLIDLFGWGTSGYDNTTEDPLAVNYAPNSYASATGDAHNVYGYGPSYTNTYLPQNIDTLTSMREYDWGQHNSISGNFNLYELKTDYTAARSKGTQSVSYNAKDWRVLTRAEWEYLFSIRKTNYGDSTGWTMIELHYDPLNTSYYKTGLLLFPDNFAKVKYKMNIVYGSLKAQYVSAADWWKLEATGCVFLPITYFRDYDDDGNVVIKSGNSGYYWTANSNLETSAYAYSINFTVGSVAPALNASSYRHHGYAVRLVHDLGGTKKETLTTYE